MEPPYNLDDEGRAELLSHLVVGQLLARASTGEWLTTDHMIELMTLWLVGNDAYCDLPERLELARVSTEIAPEFLALPCFTDPATLISFFTDGRQLNYRSPMVSGIFDACDFHLHNREASH